MVSYGDTVVLVAVTSKREVKEGQDFFPLTVDYMEKPMLQAKSLVVFSSAKVVLQKKKH